MDSAEHSAILIDVMAEIHAPFLTQTGAAFVTHFGSTSRS
jgi:hypothetical protein